MADNKPFSESGNSNLPDGYKVINFNELSQEDLHQYSSQAHDLLVKNYKEFAENKSEDAEVWEANIKKSGIEAKDGKMQIVIGVVDDKGKLVGITDTEVLPGVDDKNTGVDDSKNRYILNSYTFGDAAKDKDGKLIPADPEHYPQILQATKEGALEATKNLQTELEKSGVNTQGGLQEHNQDSANHQPKIAAGATTQVPIAGFDGYKIPLYPADVTGAAGKTMDEKLAAAKDGATPANLFMLDIKPSDSNQSMSEFMQGFGKAYVQANGALKDTPEQDPGYQSINKYASTLPKDLTYNQAFDANSALMPNKQLEGVGLTDKERADAEKKISSMTDSEKSALLRETGHDYEMVATYKAAGNNPVQRAEAVKKYLELQTAYDGEKAFRDEMGDRMTPVMLEQYQKNATATIAGGGLEEMQATLDARRQTSVLKDQRDSQSAQL
ncbi:MAG: hypothetical protein Q7T88_01670 [Methylotenera sp.]|nr:hypothetical protein [Methylotenera sp.]